MRIIKVVIIIFVFLLILGFVTNKHNSSAKTLTPKPVAVANKWTKLIEFSGTNTSQKDITSKAASDYFNLKDGHIKIDYTVTGTEEYPVLTGYVRGESQNLQIDNPYYFSSSSHSGETMATLKPGKYNLVIDCPNESFTVTIYEQG